jgi:hypothetical protein
MPVFSSAYFPSLAYVRSLFHYPRFELDLHENFLKQSIRTRAEVLTANGIVQLNVPIIHASGHKQMMAEIQIDYTKNWQTEHWRTIESAYGNAPYFEHYAYDIQAIFSEKKLLLHELNTQILSWIDQALDLNLEITPSKAYTGQTSAEKKFFLERDKTITKTYQQVFETAHGFVPNLSIIDGLMNQGPLIRNSFLPR